MKPSIIELRELARRCNSADGAALDELKQYSDNPGPVQSENFLSHLSPAARDHYDSAARGFITERRSAIH
jgi:hypothetical protein